MTSSRISTLRSVAVYTVLRFALFLAVWAVLYFLTPLDALWSAVAAILISGAISLVVLDRQRGKVGVAAGGFFSRINARIDAATRSEDIDEPWEPAPDVSGERQKGAEGQTVDEK